MVQRNDGISISMPLHPRVHTTLTHSHGMLVHPPLSYTTMTHARILDLTEEEDESSITENEEEYCSIFDDCDNQDEGQRIARHLNYDENKLATLARLAVAFSPAQQCLSLQDIEHVEILSVDHSHIDISAVVCESDGCVTIFVPVNFPNDCNSSRNMEECVLDNIVELDSKAQNMIERQDTVLVDDLCPLHTLSLNDFPSWWVQPELRPGLAEECDTIKKILNERDFEDAIKALVAKATMDFAQVDGTFQILQAAVAAVGPAGIYIRARLRRNETMDEISILDIPYSFGGDLVINAVDLRSAVLRTIAST